MAANQVYISAGLRVSKTNTTVPAAGVNTVYITAGLAPVVYTPAGGATPWIYAHRRNSQIIGVNQ